MIERIRTIVDKEWAEVFKNRVVLLTVGLMPLLLTILPLVILATMKSSGSASAENTNMPGSFAQVCGAMAPGDCLELFIMNEFLIMFMLMPLAIPVAIAAYSIVGEKTTHSLEPLLATPISTEELLAGKALAAAIPAILATWGAFAIFVIGTLVIGVAPAARASLLAPTWLIAIGVIGPLIAILAVNVAVMVSSRVNDPRAAEQISMVLIVPVLMIFFGQVAGLIVINAQLMALVAAVLVVIDVVFVYLGARLFQREAILTRWK
ncbi:MAG TPA: ABC transporter permease subunit [Anaerolineaceae bacterium]